jgi:CRP/FNR family transcriptional regulator, cyclic AMP receptor protein
MSEFVRVLVADPDLADGLRGDRLEKAIQDCVARIHRFEAGDWSPPAATEDLRDGLGLLILEGMLVRRVGEAGRMGSELLGDGDVLRPWEGEGADDPGAQNGMWRALRGGRLAVLDREFTLRACGHPEMISALVGRAIRRSRFMVVRMAILHQPRVEIRLHMLLWELAERWGHVHPDGVHLPMRLTHSMLGELVAARRPTVTMALGELADRSVAAWNGDHWLLSGRPPSELEAIHSVSILESSHIRAA